MPHSLIFTKAELKSLNQRLKGSKKDKTGIYSGRVKPKIKELEGWFKRIKELSGLLK